ncbi:MAG: DNA polymerase III subunit delta [Dehalococcoidia bacterium]
MLYILHGEDDFSIKEMFSTIKDECGGIDAQADITWFEGNKMNLNQLVNACNSVSFLSPKRLVVVEGLLGQFERGNKRRRGQSIDLKEWEALPDSVSGMPQSTILVLTEGKISRDNPLLKKLSPVAEVREFQPLRGDRLREWVLSRVTSRGGDISDSALSLLIDFIGNNLWILANEIDKLCLYVEDRRIEEADVRSLVSYARESNIFATVDAIVQKRLGLASQFLQQLLDEGTPPAYLLYMITNEFRLLIQAKQLTSQKIPKNTIGSKIGEFKDWKMDKILRNARGYSFERLEGIYRRLLDTDLSIKTGAMEGELALHLLVSDLCK